MTWHFPSAVASLRSEFVAGSFRFTPVQYVPVPTVEMSTIDHLLIFS
jgi:hypothetical protein